MAVYGDDNLKFVLLIEDYKDVLEKSQVPSIRKKKDLAVSLFIEKWREICGTELTQLSLLKKINNLKTRAKSAHVKGAPLTAWQTKILELTKV